MNIADEATTAHLKAVIEPVKRVSQIRLWQAVQAVNECFIRWGLPKVIKIDNGYPFVNPNYMDVPTKAKLWWIGLGIKVIQNTPGRPQDNGVVENLQGTCYRWANPIDFETPQQLQLQLDKTSDFQRNYYQMPKRAYMTRIGCYPELETNPRVYDPHNFKMEYVDKYLAECVWQRTIKQRGSLHFMGEEIQVGAQYGKSQAYITFDPKGRQWVFRCKYGNFLNASTKAVPNEQQIKNFAMMSKN